MERLMQYVWRHRLWMQPDMRTVDGLRVQVLDPGQLNTDAGPDFFNAKIIIDGQTWVGDVEIHVKASDWHRHGHNNDPAYKSVILHVVDRDDTLIRLPDGRTLPQLCMPCTPEFSEKYNYMVGRSDIDLPCAPHLPEIPALYITDWIETLAYERLYNKASHIIELVDRLGGDWESACYITVARSLGFSVNSEPFERLALSLPLRFIGKHSDSLFTIEALLFGQSGLIPQNPPADSYPANLMREYQFMAHKFGLTPPQSLQWKMSRMRPANFPHRRIATLAAMLHGGFQLVSRILNLTDLSHANQLLNPKLSGYWENHYTFTAPSPRTTAALSQNSINSLIINTIIPLMFACAQTHGNEPLADRALSFLQALPPEQNHISTLFKNAGIPMRDAFHTQAAIQLRRAYCQQHKCIYCRIGHRTLSRAAHP